MMDLSDKGSESEDLNSKTSDGASSVGSLVKTCADCGTTKTPLWRGGPAGPKSLCNACGIRSRKKRRALLGLNKASGEDKKSKRNSDQSSARKSGKNGKLGESMKRQLLVWQRSTVENLRHKLGEEEQAAVLLMALSCGSVYG
ncbi:GATA transcription factor 16-like [Actinidia eriantha]|uniref:GATA transcription factor 16-like n=1 Tax=Actinidia eriantha TaxID=165200 RepID=UPI00258AC052|nr:GATA transcription factor 16-like [Actinidia eriantha]XP_057471647.1 GATA transcription factor 16-like [Actinidia eriantha]